MCSYLSLALCYILCPWYFLINWIVCSFFSLNKKVKNQWGEDAVHSLLKDYKFLCWFYNTTSGCLTKDSFAVWRAVNFNYLCTTSTRSVTSTNMGYLARSLSVFKKPYCIKTMITKGRDFSGGCKHLEGSFLMWTQGWECKERENNCTILSKA